MTDVIAASAILLLAVLSAQQPAAPALDYEYFKKNVQPVFLKKRPGHARCRPAKPRYHRDQILRTAWL